MMFCRQCGAQMEDGTRACSRCGAPTGTFVPPPLPPPRPQGRSFIVTLMLCWTLGVFGVHRFYTGSIAVGLFQLFTCGGCGIWALVDFVLILAGSYRDADGCPLVHDV